MPHVSHVAADLEAVMGTSFMQTVFPVTPSAGWDTGLNGARALEALVQLKTANDMMILAEAQAAKLRQTNLVTYLRTLETYNVVKYLDDHSDDKEPPPGTWRSNPVQGMPYTGVSIQTATGQLASGPGFGMQDPQRRSRHLRKPIFGKPRDTEELPGMGTQPFYMRKIDHSPARTIDFDMAAMIIKDDLKDVLEFSNLATKNSEHLQAAVKYGRAKTSAALQQAASELNFPGLPLRAVLPPARAPKPSRPAALAPAWMDFLYAGMSQGTDPYHGLENHNVFGSPPLPPPDIGTRITGIDDKMENPVSVM